MNCENVAWNDICDKNTQERFTWAVTYLAKGEDGTGLNSTKLATAMEWAKEWKVNLVKFLIGKPIRGQEPKVHTRETAVECADAVFKFRYEQEVRAFASSSIQPYWTRNELSNIEFGRNMFEEQSRLDEVQEPLYVLPRAWSSKMQQKRNYAQLLVYLAKGKDTRKVIRNARNMMRMFAITKEQYQKLVDNAGDISRTHASNEIAQAELPL